MTRHLSLLEQQRLRQPAAPDTDHVRAIAAELIDDLGSAEPPVNIGMVASMLDIATVVEDPALDAAGCLVCPRYGHIEIRVRATDSPGRRRFTICHECGHTFFPGFATETRYRCSPGAHLAMATDLEALCDLAASHLLFPPRLFTPDLRSTSFSLKGMENLADRYTGSLEATGHRLVTGWPEPSALLTFMCRQKPSEAGTSAPPKLRLYSAHTEGDWPFFPRHKSVTPGDVFDRAYQGEIVSEVTTIAGVSAYPVRAEVHAQLYPLFIGDLPQPRVIALARQARS